MPLLGSAAMLLSFDVDAEVIDEHDRWHTQEHLPERLSLPGFLRGTRWTAITEAPRYMVLYEVASLQTLASEAYLTRLNNPTPWTARMMPHYRGMTRGLCKVMGSFGYGQGGSAVLFRFTPEKSSATKLQRWLLDEVLPGVPRMPGFASAHLLQGAQAAAMTSEQRIRGADRGVDSAMVVTGYDSDAVIGYAKRLCSSDGLPRWGATDLTSAAYDLSCTLASAELVA